jgi:sulfopropanediol 3-dehydrogenase
MRIYKTGGHRLFEQDTETSAIVSRMLADLEKNGMDAVRKYSREFDGWTPDSFELSEREISGAVAALDTQVIEDTDFCQNNVREFARSQLATLCPLEVETRQGVILGHRHIPVNTVGSYIPGGRYPMFGSAQMSIIPARVAGVKNIYACTPPVKAEGYYPATINAMKKAGAGRIFIIGGVPAFAFMAFGMGLVPPADILCGAGNKFVAEAKRQLFGRCGIDLLAGPAEILIRLVQEPRGSLPSPAEFAAQWRQILFFSREVVQKLRFLNNSSIADDSADPEMTARDLLGQAEHDPNSGVCLICFSDKFAEARTKSLAARLDVLPAKQVAERSWNDNGIVYIAESKEEAAALSGDYAPGHLEPHAADTDCFFETLTNYGSLFIGEETTVACGDKSIGTNNILPTGRAARYTGGVWVGKFLKTVTYQRMTRGAGIAAGRGTDRQCAIERMPAHGLTARARVRKYSRE